MKIINYARWLWLCKYFNLKLMSKQKKIIAICLFCSNIRTLLMADPVVYILLSLLKWWVGYWHIGGHSSAKKFPWRELLASTRTIKSFCLDKESYWCQAHIAFNFIYSYDYLYLVGLSFLSFLIVESPCWLDNHI